MLLINCPVCNQGMSEQANFCPHCNWQMVCKPSPEDMKYHNSAIVGGRMLTWGLILYIPLMALFLMMTVNNVIFIITVVLFFLTHYLIIGGAVKRSKNRKRFKRSLLQKNKK